MTLDQIWPFNFYISQGNEIFFIMLLSLVMKPNFIIYTKTSAKVTQASSDC